MAECVGTDGPGRNGTSPLYARISCSCTPPRDIDTSSALSAVDTEPALAVARFFFETDLERDRVELTRDVRRTTLGDDVRS